LFTSSNGDFDIQKSHINGDGSYVITAGLTNNGILGKTDINAKIFDENTITVDMFGAVFYRPFQYKMVTHARVFSLKPNFKISEKQGLFLSNSLHFLNKMYGYENMCSWGKIKYEKIKLPIKNDKIDYDFMGDFIAELEQARIAELEAYLLATGLKDYSLTDEEQRVLNNFDKIEWGAKYKIGDLFEKIKTIKLSYKADDLPKEALGKYVLPCLTSSFRNQGLNYFVPKKGVTILKNVISIPSNSDVYRAYFQSREFTVLSDAYAIRWKSDEIELTSAQYLFIVLCINKVTDLSIYSYKNKLGAWNVVQNKYIQMPIKDHKIDFVVMDTLISAIQKLVIKDVVLYADTKVNTTKKVVNNQTNQVHSSV